MNQLAALGFAGYSSLQSILSEIEFVTKLFAKKQNIETKFLKYIESILSVGVVFLTTPFSSGKISPTPPNFHLNLRPCIHITMANFSPIFQHEN